MSSLEKVRPGMRPRFLSQKMAAKEPEKKMPSTAAKAMMRLAEGRVLVGDPLEGPVRFLGDARHGLDGVEEKLPLGGILDVGVDEEGVHLGVDVLHRHLEAVEAPGLRHLHLRRESLH